MEIINYWLKSGKTPCSAAFLLPTAQPFMSVSAAHSIAIPGLRRRSRLGAALIETMMSMTIIALFLTGIYVANARVWSLLRSSLESNAASRVLNGRAEQIRAGTWSQVTTADYLANTVFAAAPDAAGDLAALTETINIMAYPTPSPNPAQIQVTRNHTTGTITTVGAGDGTMPNQTSIRIDITGAWTAKGGRARTRQISMVLSNGGVTGRH